MIISIIFVFFCVPETKGIPLEAMDKLFTTKPIWRAHKKVMKELQFQEEEFRQTQVASEQKGSPRVTESEST